MMKDEDKTKEQLIGELVELRQRIAKLGVSEVKHGRAEEALWEQTHDLEERVKELNCLYGISNLVEEHGTLVREILQGAADLIPPSWQHPEITCARIILEDQIFVTKNFKETIWRQSAEIAVHRDRIGTLEVCYLEERPESDEGPFLKEERNLINAIAERLGRVIEYNRAEETLWRIEWLLTKGVKRESVRNKREKPHKPLYGNLVELSTCRVLLDAVGEDVLEDIAHDYLDLLDTSAAVYEKNGDYALGIFTSGWCRFLDQASRNLCGTDDNKEAMESGKWHCHESCWTDASKVAIETGKPVDIECHGGICLYAVPIRAGGEIVGSINFGYGDPPRDPGQLRRIADTYGVSIDELVRHADAYDSRPRFLVDLAKTRLMTCAKLIGEIVHRKQTEQMLNRLNVELENRVETKTAELRTELAERKRAEEQIRQSLSEKEVLLREIHHRVKNNFQVISSLLDMIKMRTQNEEAIDLLTDARSKIYTMALVHTQLYEQKRFDQVDLANHVRKLAEHLRQVYSGKGPTIDLVLEPSDVYLTLNQAIPCALVMNEVVSNAFRHAFKEAQQGSVEVSISKSGDDMVLIRVKDDGIGIPEEMDIDKAKTLGLKLVKNIVRSQLKGRVQVSRDNGTEVTIEFKALPEGGSHA